MNIFQVNVSFQLYDKWHCKAGKSLNHVKWKELLANNYKAREKQCVGAAYLLRLKILHMHSLFFAF